MKTNKKGQLRPYKKEVVIKMDKLHISEAGESYMIKRRYYYDRCKCRPASQQKGSLSLWMICKTREELFLILQYSIV